MKANIVCYEQLIQKAMQIGGFKSKKEAIEDALRILISGESPGETQRSSRKSRLGR